MKTKGHKGRKEKRETIREFDLGDIYKLQIIQREMPGLLTVKQKKYLNEFKENNQSLNLLFSISRQDLISKITNMRLQPHRNLQEVKFLFKTGNPSEVLTLIQNEINWLEKPINFPFFTEPTKIDETLSQPRYKNDPLKKVGYYALFLKENRIDVISWWEDLLRLSEILTDDGYSSVLEELQISTEHLIEKLNSLFPLSRPWEKIEKLDGFTANTVKEYLYTSLLQFIEKYDPQIKIKTGTANRVKWHKIEQIDKQFETMISTFLQQYNLPSQALDEILKKANVGSKANPPSITIRMIVELIVESKYDISEKTLKRKRKKNLPVIKQSSLIKNS